MSELSTSPARVALRALTHGVYVLSVSDGQMDDYLIVSLAMQCSVEPPRIAFALSPNARIVSALRAANGALLSTLDVSQKPAVRRYGAPGGVRQMPADAKRSTAGHPIPPEASHWLQLKTFMEVSVGDHLLFVADVTDAGVTGVGVASENSGDSGADGSSGSFTPLTLMNSAFPYAG
ncbi:MAG: flavin reductase family protein [Gemmatimonadaceae bacterium]